MDLSYDTAVQNLDILDPHGTKLFFNELQCFKFLSGNFRMLMELASYTNHVIKLFLCLF